MPPSVIRFTRMRVFAVTEASVTVTTPATRTAVPDLMAPIVLLKASGPKIESDEAAAVLLVRIATIVTPFHAIENQYPLDGRARSTQEIPFTEVRSTLDAEYAEWPPAMKKERPSVATHRQETLDTGRGRDIHVMPSGLVATVFVSEGETFAVQNIDPFHASSCHEPEGIVRAVQTSPSGEVAAALPPTTANREPFQATPCQEAALGRVRAVQVVPSGLVPAAVLPD